MFDLVKKEDVEDQMRFFYEALTPLTFMMFRVNMVVNRVLQEPVEALKGLEDRELVKYLNLVVQFARKSVGMEESENMMELEALEAKEALLKAQVEELNEMKKNGKDTSYVRGYFSLCCPLDQMSYITPLLIHLVFQKPHHPFTLTQPVPCFSNCWGGGGR